MKASHLLKINIIATAAFYVSSFVALGNAVPTVDSSGQDVVQWFTDHGQNARIYAWTSAFISLGLAVFGGQVASLLPKPNRYIFLIGIIGCAVTVQVQGWFWAGMAFRPQELDPAVARTLFDIPTFWGPLINGSMATMALAVAALGFGRSPVIPRWLTGLSVIFMLEQLVETVTVFGQSGFIAPGGAMNVYLGGALGFLWVAGVVHWASGRMDAA